MIDILLSGPLAFIFRPIFLNVLRLIQDGMIFKPTKTETGKVEPLLHPTSYNKFNLEGINVITLRTIDNLNLTAWYKPPEEGKPTFLYLPGNTGHFGDCGCGLANDSTVLDESRDYRLLLIEELIKDGRGLLAICYRGFGTSDGKPSEEGLNTDVKTAWGYLEDEDVNPRDVVVYGDSLGGAVGFKLIAEIPNHSAPAVIITTGTFASIAHKAHDIYPQIPIEAFKPYLKHPYNSLEHIKKLLNTRVVLMHGINDDTTYPYHSEMLANSARSANIDAIHIPVKDAEHIDISPTDIISAALDEYEKTKPI